MSADHTPTPWEIGPVTPDVNEVANVRGVTIIGPRKAVGCRDEAEHIVRCVNSFDDLVAALIQALGSCCPECLFMLGDEGSGHPPECPIGAVLAKARGEV